MKKRKCINQNANVIFTWFVYISSNKKFVFNVKINNKSELDKNMDVSKLKKNRSKQTN